MDVALDKSQRQSGSDSFLEVWLITVGRALTHWYPATFFLLLPLIGLEFGLSYGQIGMILTAQFAAGAVSNLPGGILVDSIRRKGLILAAALFWIGIPYLIMGYSNAYWMLLVCSALIGVGNNLWHPTAIPWLARRFPKRRGLMMAYHGMGGNAGDALAPLATGALLTAFAWMTWRDIVVINIIPGVAVGLLILWFLGRFGTVSEVHSQAGHEQMNLRQVVAALPKLFSNRTLIILSTSSAFRSMTQKGVMTILPLYLAVELGYDPWSVGVLLFLMQAAGFAAAPIAGHMSDRLGRRIVIVSSMAMTATVIAMRCVAGGTPLFVFFVALLGFFLFAIRPVLQAWLIEATPPYLGGTAIGAMFGLQSVGAAAGPLFSGMIADRWGLLSAFWFLSGTIVVANLLVFLIPHQPHET